MSITDGNGNFRIPNVNSGWHKLTVDYRNYKQYSKTIEVPMKDINIDDIYMHGYTIDGYVKYPNSLDPIYGAKVSLKNSPNWTVYTDINGYFTFQDVLPGGYELTVSYQGYESYSKWISFDNQDLTLGDIWLHGYTISGFILDQYNKGIANALVYINDKSRAYTTDTSGYYAFTEVLGGGTYHTIYVEKSGYTPNPASISVTVNTRNVIGNNIVLHILDNKSLYKNNQDKFTVIINNIDLDGKDYSYVKNTETMSIESNVYSKNELSFYIDANKNVVTSKSTITNLELLRFYNHMQQWNTFTAESIEHRQTDIDAIVKMINTKILKDPALDEALKIYSKVSLKALKSAKATMFTKPQNLSKKVKKYLKDQIGDPTVENMIGYAFNNFSDTLNTEDKQLKYIDAALSYPNEIEALTNLCLASYYYNQVNNNIKKLKVNDSTSINRLINNYDMATKYYEVSIKFAKDSNVFKDLNVFPFDTWVSELSDRWANAITSSTITDFDETPYGWISKFLKYKVKPLKWYDDAIRTQNELYELYEGYIDIAFDSTSHIVNNLSKCKIKMMD